ncbi:hypothetical protein LTR85_003742 [Meristemomyces frigidus]|nr:hypothetical protein LTR85_003742 [Meristemomyces frigidus]
MASDHQLNFLEKMAALRHDPKYADFTIICDGYEFRAHRAIACTVVPELSQRLNGQFQEALTGVIKLKEVEGPTVARVLDYVYTLDYGVDVKMPDRQQPLAGESLDESAPLEPDSTVGLSCNESLILHTKVHALADYWHMVMLKALAVEKFSSSAKQDWKADGFTEVALIDVTYNHIVELMADESFLTTVADMQDHNNFQADLIRKLITENSIDGAHFVESKEELERQLADTKAELTQTNATAKDRGDWLGVIKKEFYQLKHLIGALGPCGNRQCQQRFIFALQRDRHQGKYFVSCHLCGKRYD